MNQLFLPETPLAEQLRAVELPLGDTSRAQIVLLVADDALLRRAILRRLIERLDGTYTVYPFDYRAADPPSLPRFCRSLPGTEPVCVLAYGLEELKESDADRYAIALAFLNNQREDIRARGASVVLALTSQTHADVLRQAPDFADWRAADVSFALPNGLLVEPTALGQLNPEDALRLRRQQRRLIETLARLQEQPPSEIQAELRKQLAETEKQLGNTDASDAAYREASRILTALDAQEGLLGLYRQYVIDRLSKLTIYSVTSDAPLAVDLERVFVSLETVQSRVRKETADAEELLSELVSDSPFASGSDADSLAALRPEGHRRTSDGRDGETRERTIVLPPGVVLRKDRCVAILGAPGAGKTTLLKYLALTFARRAAAERLGLDEVRVPLFIVLRDFVRRLPKTDAIGAEDLAHLVDAQVREMAPHLQLPRDLLPNALARGQCIVLLDGLDEVADAPSRARLARALTAWAREAKGNRFVVTSRPRGYEGEVKHRLDPLFAECTIRDFDTTEMEAFARGWYQCVLRERLGDTPYAAAEADRGAAHLVRAIQADSRVTALARNPLLLSVLAMVHQRGVGLPQRRAELYDECTDQLLGYWDQTKGGEAARELASQGELSRNERRALLEPIALWFQERGEAGARAEETELKEEIARQFGEILGDPPERARERAELFLRVIEERAGLLIGQGRGSYTFAHKTFQEYLAARALADRDDYVKASARHLHDPWWREVLLLEVGHLSDQRHFGRRARKLTTDLIQAFRQRGSWLEEVLKRDLIFTGRCLADVGKLGVEDSVRHALLDELLNLWRGTPFEKQREELVALFVYYQGTVNGSYVMQELLRRLDDADADTRLLALRALIRIAKESPNAVAQAAILRACRDSNALVRRVAVRALAVLPDTHEVEAVLLDALRDASDLVRQAALEQFPRPTATERLRWRSRELQAAEDPDPAVRKVALELLSHLGETLDDDGVLTALLRGVQDTDPGVRAEAARSLGRFYTRKHELTPAAAAAPALGRILTALRHALQDADPSVCQAAVLSLSGLGWRARMRDEAIERELLQILRRAEPSLLRDTITAALRFGGSEVRATLLPILLDVLHDQQPEKREAAVSAINILSAWSTDEQAELQAILTTLRTDPEARVRQRAAAALGTFWKSGTDERLNGLCQALEDIDVMVRAQAAAALGSMKAAAAQKPYLTALLRTLQDSEPAIREIAAHALRDIGREARADLLDCALPVPPAGSWTWVPWAQSSQSVRAALRKALDDRESGVRRAAARALGAITPPNSDDRTEEELIAFWRGQVSDFGYEELLRFAEHRTGTAAEEGP